MQKILLHREGVVVPEPNGIGQGDPALFFVGEGLSAGQQIGVQGLHRHAQDLLHLGQGLAPGAVGCHGQGAEDGQGGQQDIFSIFHLLPQQPEGQPGGYPGSIGGGGYVGDNGGGDALHQVPFPAAAGEGPCQQADAEKQWQQLFHRAASFFVDIRKGVGKVVIICSHYTLF